MKLDGDLSNAALAFADHGSTPVAQGDVRWKSGKIGQAIELDGKAALEVPGLAGFDTKDRISFGAWIFTFVGAAKMVILSKVDERAGGRGYELVWEAGGKLSVRLGQRAPGQRLEVVTGSSVEDNEWHHVLVTYDGTGKAAGVGIYVDGKIQKTKTVGDKPAGSLVTHVPLRIGGRSGDSPFIGLLDEVAVYRWALRPDEAGVLAKGEAIVSLADVLMKPARQRTTADEISLQRFYVEELDPRHMKLKADLAKVSAAKAKLESTLPTALVSRDITPPRLSYVLDRGAYDRHGEVVSPGVPASLSSFVETQPTDRLGLARWLTDPEHPLTARVAVNRWWEMVFGTGLVETSEDFGSQGSYPSHPELLDWLATELVRNGWNVKRLHELIVMSATYRQSSGVSADLLEKDPRNKLLARGPRFRMSAEMVRDNALAISGLLKEKIGGPSVKPYQPPGLWEDVSVERRGGYVQDKGDGLHRRSLYTFWKRTCPPPALATFDAPGRETCTILRARTNTPLQALVLMNDPTYVEASRKLAERVLRKTRGRVDTAITEAFRLAVARAPQKPERDALATVLQDARAYFESDPESRAVAGSRGFATRCPSGSRGVGGLDHGGQHHLEHGSNNHEGLTMNPFDDWKKAITRRHLFGKGATAVGAAVLSSLMKPVVRTATAAGFGRDAALPHFAPRAKRVIYLFQSGGQSHLDLFDPKPKLGAFHGTELPDSIRKGQRLTGMTSGQKSFPVIAPKFKFERHDKTGLPWSELLPYTAEILNDVCLVRSMHTEAINHDPAITFIQTGSQQPGRPSLGAWAAYGLGSEAEDLPAFVVMISHGSGKDANQGLLDRLWGAGFLPSSYQGVKLRSGKDPVLYLSDPPGIDRTLRRKMLDQLEAINQAQFAASGDPEIQTRISQYEMAFRMQASVPAVTDLSHEPASTFDLYGPDSQRPGSFAANCLLARQLVERGTRFVQLYHRGWDHHNTLPTNIPKQCRDVDQPQAALVHDLKQRGLLDETLVIAAGEFGRTVYGQGGLIDDYGRDHHGRCFSLWMAGGGIKPGLIYGETDDYGYNIVRDPVHIHDLNATILHCLGMDHERLTFKFQGRNYRLTDVEGRVVKGLLASA